MVQREREAATSEQKRVAVLIGAPRVGASRVSLAAAGFVASSAVHGGCISCTNITLAAGCSGAGSRLSVPVAAAAAGRACCCYPSFVSTLAWRYHEPPPAPLYQQQQATRARDSHTRRRRTAYLPPTRFVCLYVYLAREASLLLSLI